MKKHTISLQKAIQWTKKWRQKTKGTSEVKGFLIPLDDFQEIIKEPNIHSVRAYLGEDGNTEKIIFVGVDADGKDMLPVDENGELSGNGDYIFDFSRPIPPFDDPNSPLNG